MPKHILIVDDEEAVRFVLQKSLTRYGLVVHTAEDGQTGLNYWQANREIIDLVISDNDMPKMCGIVMLKHILAINPATKAIMISGLMPEMDETLLQGVLCLCKPVILDQLTSYIAQQIGGFGEI